MGNYGRVLIMGKAGFISSTVLLLIRPPRGSGEPRNSRFGTVWVPQTAPFLSWYDWSNSAV